MIRIFPALALLLCSLTATASAKPSVVDLTPQFAKIASETAGLEAKARSKIALERLDALFPGFYARDGIPLEKRLAKTERALNDFDTIRSQYERAQRDFPIAYAAGIARMRKFIPGFESNLPTYFLHSLGEMVGGTRKIREKTYLIFGADLIGRLFTGSQDLAPAIDHELLHVENIKYFGDCEVLWCGIWVEGLAMYAVTVLNPGVDDQELSLNFPEPIRVRTEAVWPAALCQLRDKMDSITDDDYAAFLLSSGDTQGRFPKRFGYYLGLKIVENVAANRKLIDLVHLSNTQAKPVFKAALDGMIEKAGGCSSPA